MQGLTKQILKNRAQFELVANALAEIETTAISFAT